MKVISLSATRAKLRSLQPSRWHPDETEELMRLFAAKRQSGEAERYAYGETDRRDPQFYILSSDPAQPCSACVSRLTKNGRRWYVIEDGGGAIEAEGEGLRALATRVGGYWRVARHLVVVALAFVEEWYLDDDAIGPAIAAIIACVPTIA